MNSPTKTLLEDEHFLTLTWNGEHNIIEDRIDFSIETSGKIWLTNPILEKRVSIGSFRVFEMRLGSALDAGVDNFDVFDLRSETVDYFDALMGDESFNFSEAVIDTLTEMPFGFDVLIIDRIEIAPKYQGNGFGLQVMLALMNRFQGASLVAIKPFPLQFEGNMPSIGEGIQPVKALKKWNADFTTATKKLVDYYAHLKFAQIPGTEFMITLPEVKRMNVSDISTKFNKTIKTI